MPDRGLPALTHCVQMKTDESWEDVSYHDSFFAALESLSEIPRESLDDYRVTTFDRASIWEEAA